MDNVFSFQGAAPVPVRTTLLRCGIVWNVEMGLFGLGQDYRNVSESNRLDGCEMASGLLFTFHFATFLSSFE